MEWLRDNSFLALWGLLLLLAVFVLGGCSAQAGRLQCRWWYDAEPVPVIPVEPSEVDPRV